MDNWKSRKEVLWWTCQSSELQLLHTIKARFKDPLRSFSNWNSSLSFCQWNGVSCDSLSRVNKIELSGKNLSGSVPKAVFQLQHVETINLSNNQFSGSIPGNLSSCLSLKHLNLSNNNFTGPLPKGSVPFLETYDYQTICFQGQSQKTSDFCQDKSTWFWWECFGRKNSKVHHKFDKPSSLDLGL